METEEIMLTFIGSVIFLLIFFTLGRMLVTWFYKIDARVNAAERTNYLLEQFLKANGIDFLPSENNETMIEVKHKKTNNVLKVNLKTWEQMKRDYGEENYDIINQ